MVAKRPQRLKKLPQAMPSSVAVDHSGELLQLTPLELMLKIMHELYAQAECCNADAVQNSDLFGFADHVQHQDGKETRIKLLNMAAAVGRHVAPYMHPRLSAIEHTGKDGAPLQSGVLLVPSIMSLEEWEKAAVTKQKI
jgi:hypothetical protein